MSDISENVSHPIKAASIVILNFDRIGRAEIHREGCQHAKKADSVRPFEVSSILADDWFEVAPCARRK